MTGDFGLVMSTHSSGCQELAYQDSSPQIRLAQHAVHDMQIHCHMTAVSDALCQLVRTGCRKKATQSHEVSQQQPLYTEEECSGCSEATAQVG